MIPPLDGAFPFPWLSFQRKNSKQTMQRDKMSDDKPFEKQETIETSLFQVGVLAMEGIRHQKS
jgi:hypothetical protein